ncbi:protein kinase-like domain, Phloem protein 2-like protein [Artemisia annua]|uniref:Protein kinase-like domain, Phloem protein 2-like protein n=1 Tax=Artemisia annua TaxID=35608 RepID=A0A2U1MJA5_ARTAN|nr:protein kinase-like domain, Phloem protein 2-like protein [Artemisia annua]
MVEVEQEQVLEDEKLSDDLLWTFNEEDLCTNILKWFKDNGQEAYAVDNNGKKSLKVSARGIITSTTRCFWPSPQSRFGELAMSTYNRFDIEKKIKCDALTPGTTYACYLVYISNEEQPVMEVTRPYEIMRYMRPYEWYIYLVIPPDTPIIGRKLDQNTHSLLNRPKLDYVPRKRSDGLMEVKVSEFQTQTTGTTNIHISLRTPQLDASTRLIIDDDLGSGVVIDDDLSVCNVFGEMPERSEVENYVKTDEGNVVEFDLGSLVQEECVESIAVQHKPSAVDFGN